MVNWLPFTAVLAFLGYAMVAPQQAMDTYQTVARKVIVDRMVESIVTVPAPAPTGSPFLTPPTPR